MEDKHQPEMSHNLATETFFVFVESGTLKSLTVISTTFQGFEILFIQAKITNLSKKKAGRNNRGWIPLTGKINKLKITHSS